MELKPLLTVRRSSRPFSFKRVPDVFNNARETVTQDSYDIWTFPDHLRADVRGSAKIDSQQVALTGMALSFNSTVVQNEFRKTLPPCPILLISNSEGALQAYYFIHQNLPSVCHAPQAIKLAAAAAAPPPPPSTSATASLPTQPSANGFTIAQSSFTLTPTTTSATPLPKELSHFGSALSFPQPAKQIVNGSSPNDFGKTISMNTAMKPVPPPPQPTPIKTILNTNTQPSTRTVPDENLPQLIKDFEAKLSALVRSSPKPPDTSADLNKSLEKFTATLNGMNSTVRESMQAIKTMISGHIESEAKIENAHYQLRLSQKENQHHSLKDRELDPWTQLRLDSIGTRCEQLKRDLSVLLQLTPLTFHDKSLSGDTDEGENEDFIPDFEILNTSKTMKQRMSSRMLELGRKVTEVDKDLETICSGSKAELSSSKTFNKTTMSSERPFHSSDAEILAYLRTTRPAVTQVSVPSPVAIQVSSASEPSKKPSTIEVSQRVTTPTMPSTPQQPNGLSAESESFKNMLRIVQASIDLFSGATSPEQLQELSKSIATSPLSSTHRSNHTSTTSTSSVTKTASLPRISNLPKAPQTTGISQTPARSVGSSVPSISVTPATPANQGFPLNGQLQFSQAKSSPVPVNDLTKSQAVSSAGDSTIRSLLNNNVVLSTNTTPTSAQSGTAPPSIQVSSSISTGSLSTLKQTVSVPATSAVSNQLPFAVATPSSTTTTSVQATSPTTKPVLSTGPHSFGAQPALPSSPLNLSSSFGSTMPFGNTSTATTTTSATTSTTSGSVFGIGTTSISAIPSPFGSGFGTSSSTIPASTVSASVFSAAPSSTASPFGAATTITPASTASPFGAVTTTTPASTASPFGAITAITPASTTSIFGTPTTSVASPFGTLTTAAPSTTGPFGSTTTTAPSSIFGAPAASSASTTGVFGSVTTSTPSPFGTTTTAATPTVGIFGSSATTPSSSFGAPATTSASTTGGFGSGFGSSAAGTSPFGSSFTSTTPASGTSVFGTALPAPAKSVFGGFGAISTAPSTSGGFGASPTIGSGASSTGFGASPSFGSHFAGFGAASKSSAPTSGFSFGGFGGQTTDAAAPSPTFASFGSSAPPQASSPPGGSLFGAPPASATGFNASSSAFGGPPTQSATSPSFTSYRK